MLSTLAQYSDLGTLVLSLAVAIIFTYHGWPKLTKPEGMATAMGWPAILVRFLGLVEIVSGLAILLGIQVQLAAFALSLIMLGAIYAKITKWKIPFSSSTTTGWEFDFILLAATLFILVS